MTIASEHREAIESINLSIKQNTGEHMIAGHSDTIATGAQLNELVSGGGTTLHSHPGGGNYTDRGDPASWDFSKTDFSTDGAYHTLDLSNIVPEGASLVHLLVHGLIAYNNSIIIFRKKGNINDVNREILYLHHGNSTHLHSLWVACDVDRKIEYWMSDRTWVSLDVVVRGWI